MENIINLDTNPELDNSAETARLMDELGDLDSLLAADTDDSALDAIEEIIETVAEEAEIVADAPQIDEEEVLGDALRELDMQEARAEAYAEQEADAEATDMNTELPEPEARVEPKQEKPRTPRVSSAGKKKSEVIAAHLGANSSEFFVLEADDAELDADELKAKEKEVLAAIDALPKKVGEKATNLFNYLKTGERLSIYTKIALDLLVDKDRFTTEELRDKMLAAGYTQGTSNSQTQQMMQLLPALKIGARVKNLMALNDESMILAKYRAASATPATEEEEEAA